MKKDKDDFYIKNIFKFKDKNGKNLIKCKSVYSSKFGNLTKKEKLMLNYEKIINQHEIKFELQTKKKLKNIIKFILKANHFLDKKKSDF